MSKIKGIDISYWQGDIDFKKVKMSDDVRFVILREGYRQTVDKKFMDYVFGCRTWGIPIHGVYHFIYMMNDRITSNSETGRLNAESCLRNIRDAQLRKDEIIVWCDLEYDTVTHAKRTHGIDITSQDIREITVAFCNTITKAGYRVGLYTNLDYAKHKYGLDFIKNYDLWLADYSGNPDIECSYHQYTSDGSVDGISGKVDMNWHYTDNKEEEKPMGRTAQDLLNVARGWLGCSESNGTHRQIIDLYNSVKPLPRGYAVKYSDEWCDTFVSACGIKAGCSDLIGRECGCEQHVNIFKNLGIWIEDGTIKPQAGDIILYNWDAGVQPNNGYSDHIGIVESVSGYTITVIEGNMNERVGRRNIRIGHGNIRGYARPRYSTSSGNQSVQPSKPVKDLTTIAKEVISGVWGNGEDRKARLESAGYDFNKVQAEVNRILSGASSKPSLKPLSEIAREVLQGKWGNGNDRKSRLESAGYNYQAVQNEVNRLSGASSVDINKIAHDVIRGAYGNGSSRRNALVAKFGASVADAVQRRVNQLL